MKYLLVLLLCVGMLFSSSAQFDTAKTASILNYLAADNMKGRALYSAELDSAAAFISRNFAKSGLKFFNSNSYLQEFSTTTINQISLSGKVNDNEVSDRNVSVFYPGEEFSLNNLTGFETDSIVKGENAVEEMVNALSTPGKKVVLVDTAFKREFKFLNYYKRNLSKIPDTTIFIQGLQPVNTLSLTAKQEIRVNKLSNVIGLLPGRGRKEEFVIFSAHYDHVGMGNPIKGDSIYNGANDNAAGTTAIIMLADYFSKLKNNERSILFVAFTGEESGGFGSKHFSEQLDPEKISAMFNIEMIGTESKWGKNSAYVTGYEKSDLGMLMQKNLKGTGFEFHPDPYPAQNLFYRSDNATLAKLGVPAHTISSSKMDNEPHYHKVSDEVSTLDIKNMAAIIKAIALSSRSIIAGTDTPSRVAIEK